MAFNNFFSRILRLSTILIALALSCSISFSAPPPADDPTTLLTRARMMTAQQRYSDAIGIYLKITSQYSDSPVSFDAWQELSDIYTMQNRAADAAAALEKLYEKNPAGPYAPQALFNKGRILANSGRTIEAVDVLRKFIQKFPDNANAIQAEFQLSGILGSQGKFDDSAAVLKKCLSSKDPQQVMQARRSLADMYFQARRYYEAEGELHKIIEADQGNEYYLELLARTYTEEKESDKAESIYQKLMAAHQGDPNFENKLFAFYDKTGMMRDYAERLQAKANANPHDTDTIRRLVHLYMWQKSSIDALRELEKLVAANPQNYDDAVSLARLYFENQWKSKAAETLKKVLADVPNFGSAWQLLGDIYHADGKDSDARAAWEKSVGFSPNDAGAYQRLGGLFIGKTMFAEATALYEEGRKTLGSESLFNNDLIYLYKIQMRSRDALVEYLRMLTTGQYAPYRTDEMMQIVEQPDIRDQALELIRTWLAKSMESRPLLQFYAFASFDLKAPDDALDKLAEWDGRHTDQPDILADTAYIMLNSGKYESAAQIFLKTAERDTEPAMKSSALMGASRAFLWGGESAEASDILRKLISDYPDAADTPDALFTLAGIETGAGDFKSALEHYSLFVKDFPDNTYEDEALLGQARCMLNTGDFSGADSAIDALWKRGGNARNYDEMLFLQAEDRYLRGMLTEAEPLYRKVVESYPESLFVNDSLERLLFITDTSGIDTITMQAFMSALKERTVGNLDRAATLLEGMSITLAKTPLYSYAQFELAKTLSAQGKTRDAEDLFLKLADSQPDSETFAMSLIHAAELQLKQNRPTDALHTYQRLIDTDPGNFWASKAREQVQKLSATISPGS